MKHLTLQALIQELQKQSHYRAADYAELESRIGESHLRSRLMRQLQLYNVHRSGFEKKCRKFFRRTYRKLIVWGLWSLGQLANARQEARSPEWVEESWVFEDLPGAFDGYRILQLSDFHFDFISELPEIIKTKIANHHFDCCVLTGDYRGETTGPYEESLDQLKEIRPYLGENVFAVLGNHDNVEIILSMQEMEIQVLMNQMIPLKHKGGEIKMAGIDDPHFYQTHDLSFLHSQVEAFVLLLSHSPESWKDAEAAKINLQLSGHTHGGQICLPGGVPVICHLHDCPGSMIKGRWSAGNLQGYTSRGVGSSSLDLRLNCPPEITLHTLRCGQGMDT